MALGCNLCYPGGSSCDEKLTCYFGMQFEETHFLQSVVWVLSFVSNPWTPLSLRLTIKKYVSKINVYHERIKRSLSFCQKRWPKFQIDRIVSSGNRVITDNQTNSCPVFGTNFIDIRRKLMILQNGLVLWAKKQPIILEYIVQNTFA